MATIKRFEDIEAWRKARALSIKVYEVTNLPDFSKDWALKNQVRRSSGSVMDNIAEGFERDGKAEFIYFLSIAKGSNGEVRSQLHRALDQGYIDQNTYKLIIDLSNEIGKMISGLIAYLNKTGIKGSKYKGRNP
ncbi:MAG: four helix bundle protein [Balneolales bacterium]